MWALAFVPTVVVSAGCDRGDATPSYRVDVLPQQRDHASRFDDAPVVTGSVAPERRCVPPARVDPRVLAADWPNRLGQRVLLTARIERNVGLLDAVLVAEGVRFAALLTPQQRWAGTEERTFIVMGAAQLPVHGSTALAQLMLDDGSECP